MVKKWADYVNARNPPNEAMTNRSKGGSQEKRAPYQAMICFSGCCGFVGVELAVKCLRETFVDILFLYI